MAFVLDREGRFERAVNRESVIVQRLASAHWEGVVHALIEEHARETGSKWAAGLLAEWDRTRQAIWQVCPKEMVNRLAHPLSDDTASIAAE
jgi:glutamate synthase (NADPH/NADH) large chain